MTIDAYKFDPDFERKLLAFLLRDIKFFTKCQFYVKPQYFSDQIERDIWISCQPILEKYGEPLTPEVAKNEVLKFFYDTKKRDIEVDTYNEMIDALWAEDLNSAKDYTTDKVVYFAQNQAMKNLWLDSIIPRIKNKQDLQPIMGDVQKVLSIGQEMTEDVLSKLRTWAEIDPNKKTEWLIDKILPRYAITSIYGTGGLGKSHVVYYMARCIMEGVDFFEHEVKRCPVYYLDYENTEDIRAHIVKTCGQSNVVLWDNQPETPPLPSLDNDNCIEVFKTFPPGLIIVDSLRSATLANIQDDTEAAILMARVQKLKKMGHTIILILHTLKGDVKTFKGNQVIMDLGDHTLALFTVKSLGEIEEDGADLDPHKPKLLFFGTRPEGDKSRYEKQVSYLFFDPNVPSLKIAGELDVRKLKTMYDALQDVFNRTGNRPCQKEWLTELAGRIGSYTFYKLLPKGIRLKYWKEFEEDKPKTYLPLNWKEATVGRENDDQSNEQK